MLCPPRPRVAVLVAVMTCAAACGGASAARKGTGQVTEDPSHSTTQAQKANLAPEPFVASTPEVGDVVCRYVRPERSSRLEGALPKGRPHESLRATFPESLRPSFVLAAGNRIAVVGAASYALFDTKGTPVETGDVDAQLARIDRGTGRIATAKDDEVPPGDIRSRFAIHDGAFVTASGRAIRVAPRDAEAKTIEGSFEAVDVSIDEGGVAQVLVRQGKDLVLWSVPLRVGSVGRTKLAVTTRGSVAPPILGKTLRVLVLEDRMVAVALDGRKLWERGGALTGGATITLDDHLLVADGPKVYAVDPRGNVTPLLAEPSLVFVTPPVIAGGMLLVASGRALHGYRFD